MATIRELLVKINGDNSGLNNALIKTGQDLKAIEQNAKATAAAFTDFGKKMTMAVSLPLAALGTYMVIAATDSEKAMALLANSIKAVGNEGKVSVKVLADYADELQHTTKWDDEVTMGAMRMLESLTGLNEKGIKAIIPSIQDFASAWGMDLEQAASLVGKTIASNTNALGRYGIQVDSAASQSEKFAQVLKGLARYQGTAATEGMTFAGQLAILKNEAEELASEFGKEMMPMLTDLVKSLRGLVEQFSQMPEGTKRAILAAMAFAAAIGPASSAIGGMIQSFSMLKGVFKLAVGPAGWIMLAVAALVAIGVAIGTNIQKQKEYDAVMAGTSKKAAEDQIRIVEAQIRAAKDYYDKVTEGQETWSKSEQKNQRTIVESAKKDIESYQARLDMLRVLQREQEAFAGTSTESTAAQVKLLTDGTVRIANEKAAIDKKIAEMQKLLNPEVTAALGESDAMKKLKTQLSNINAELEKYKERIDSLKSGKTKPSDDGLGLQGAAEAIEDTTVAWLGFNNATELADVMMRNATQASKELTASVTPQAEAVEGVAVAWSEADTSISNSEADTSLSNIADGFTQISSVAGESAEVLSAVGNLIASIATVNVSGIVSSVLSLIGMVSFGKELSDAFTRLAEPLMKIVDLAVNLITVINPVFLIVRSFLPLVVPIIEILGTLAEAISNIIEIGFTWVKDFFKPISDWLAGLAKGVKDFLVSIGLIKADAEPVAESVVVVTRSVEELTDAFLAINNISDRAGAFGEIISSMKDSLRDSLTDEMSKAIATSLEDSITSALETGSQADFSQAIGKMVYSIASQFILQAVGLQPMIKKLAAMITAALSDGTMSADELAGIQSYASTIYSTAQAALAPLQGIVNSTFGTSYGTGGSGGGSESIGSFASGVRNFSGGIARVGEQGPETLRLPRGSSIEPGGAKRIGGATFVFNSPKQLSPMEMKMQMMQASRQVAFETGGNL
jgi:hypothetical protein